MKLVRKGTNEILKRNTINELEYLTFPLLESAGFVSHLFTTRLGGVSEGIFSSMNLSYTRGDKKEAIDENYARIAKLLKRNTSDFVCSDQTHTTNIRHVTDEDRGKGVVRDKDYTDIDGLITNVPGIVLSTFYADCVPLYFVDCKNRAIGLSHSGWRGTVGRMGEHTLHAMKEAFGTRPEHVLAAIGPSICMDCYEISEDVASEFVTLFPGKNVLDEILYKKTDGKYQLDLWKANYYILLESGILPRHISVTDICTCCNPDYLFSHRASHGKRGNLAAFLSIDPF